MKGDSTGRGGSNHPAMTTMQPASHLLLVEDESAHLELIQRAFESAPQFRISVAENLAQARAVLGGECPELVITDLRLPDGRGIELLPNDGAVASYAVVIMTSQGGEGLAVEAVKAGALDYIVKSETAFLEMPRVAARALREWRLTVQRHRVELALAERESELRHAQKMEAIGRLASGIAHDFNNVLMGIIGCADVAISKLASPPEARRYILDLKNAALAGAATARGLLAFSRSDVQPSEIDLDGAISGLRDVLRVLVGSDVALEVVLGAPGGHVRCGAGEVEQVVMNLAINARDAMPAGGVLTIQTAVLTSDTGGADPHQQTFAVVTVRDNGTGMDEATRARAFEPFFTTKRPGKGSGLGLSSVYGVVTRCGGRVEFDSVPGVGTVFRVYLPAIDAPVWRPSASAERVEAGVGTVLVVEDDDLVRRSVCHYLETAGHGALAATTAHEAEEMLSDPVLKIGVLLTDVGLPDKSGAELAASAERKRPGLPIVFMSGHAHQTLDRAQRLPAGAALLRKPFKQEDLLAMIGAALANGPGHRELTALRTDETRAPPPIASEQEEATLLIVEDHAPSLNAMRELLTDSGFRVLAAATADAARSLFRENSETVAALITDMSLPDGLGSALAMSLRATRPDLSVVVVSGREKDDPDVQQVLGAPPSAFVSKPVQIDDLVTVVNRLLQLATNFRPAGELS